MKKKLLPLLILAWIILFSAALATAASDVPKKKQTALGLYLTAKEAFSKWHVDAANLAEGADRILTRRVNEVLQIRFADQVVSMEDAAAGYAEATRDRTLDTPRKIAKQFGENVHADLVVIGTIWRFREKGTVEENPDSPASVAFSVYLMEVSNGKRLWHNAFEGTQKTLSEDILGGLKQIKMGLRWLSVNELARYGVKNVFRTFPLT